jgi:2-polyprenyl-3-methyl-5-hydroxy-6-metoxy-1,4-benzoquinol methylase
MGATSNCPLCSNPGGYAVHDGVPDYRYGVPGVWSFVHFACCGVASLSPPPTEPLYGYPAEYKQHQSSPLPTQGSSRERRWIRAAVLQVHGYELEPRTLLSGAIGKLCNAVPMVRLAALWGSLLVPQRSPSGRLLDIGCGNGRFLANMQLLGWDVRGVEPDRTSAQLASRLCGVQIYPDVETALHGEQPFQVITMNHVFEHIRDPQSTLAQVWQLLRPGGKLAICLPNWKSAAHRIFGRYWRTLEPPRHVLMYEPHGLAKLVGEMGFIVDKVYTTSVRDGGIAFRRSWRYKFGKDPSEVRARLWYIMHSVQLRLHSDVGEEIVLWAVRP